jgi:ribosome-binding protein aMBF1 (putative translation factor)
MFYQKNSKASPEAQARGSSHGGVLGGPPPGKEQYFELGSQNLSTLTAFLLRRQRMKQGLSLEEVAKRLGAKSHNTYARYEQGKSIPSIEKFSKLLTALSPNNDFVLIESPMKSN